MYANEQRADASLCDTDFFFFFCPAVCTFDGLTLGQNGDCPLRHLLLVYYRGDLWAPAVRAHPDEMTRLVGLFSRMEEPPAKKRENRCSARIRSAFGAGTHFDFFLIFNTQRYGWEEKKNHPSYFFFSPCEVVFGLVCFLIFKGVFL